MVLNPEAHSPTSPCDKLKGTLAQQRLFSSGSRKALLDKDGDEERCYGDEDERAGTITVTVCEDEAGCTEDKKREEKADENHREDHDAERRSNPSGNIIHDDNSCNNNSNEEQDVLKLHRVKKFTNPHQLDRSCVCPELEDKFMELVAQQNVEEAMDLMRSHVADKKLLLTNNALSSAIERMEGANAHRLIKAMILFPLVDFSTKARAPVAEAVKKQDVKLVKLLLLGPITDVNKGAPLALAVDSGNTELVRTLVASDRINPNKGGPLYRAVGKGNKDIVSLLLSHKRININKFSGGVGSTALCRAIDVRDGDAVDMLLRQPKIDINKGFLLTPLQHAVDTRSPEMVRKLLEAETQFELDTNKKLGGACTPFMLALQGPNAPELCRLILSCAKTNIDPEVIQHIESEDLVEIEQVIIESGRSLPLGAFWYKRIVNLLIDTHLLISAQVIVLPLLVFLCSEGYSLHAALTAAALVAGNIVALASFARKRKTGGQVGTLCLRSLPILYDIQIFALCIGCIVRGKQPVKRSELYQTCCENARLQAFFVCLPQLIVQIIFAVFALAGDGDPVWEDCPVFFAVLALNFLLLFKLGAEVVAGTARQYFLAAKVATPRLAPRHRRHRDDDANPPMVHMCDTEMLEGHYNTSTKSYTDLQSTTYTVGATPQLLPAAVSALTVSSINGGGSDMERTLSSSRRDRLRPPELNLDLITKNRTVSLPPRIKDRGSKAN